MMLNLQFILFFVYFDIQNLKKLLMHHFFISGIIIYCTTIILNKPNKIANCIEFKVVKD